MTVSDPIDSTFDLPEIATSADVARVLQMTPSALAQARYLGRGPSYIKVGHLVRYLRADVLAYLRQNRINLNP